MNTLYLLSSFSISVPFLTGIFLFNRMDKVYRPFFWFIALTLANEIITSLLTTYKLKWQVFPNVFCLVDALMLLYIFNKWQLFKQRKYLYRLFLIAFPLIWVLDFFAQIQIIDSNQPISLQTIGQGLLEHFLWYFNIIYSFTTVLLSIAMINKLANRESRSLHSNPKFVISTAFIFLYCFAIIHTLFLIPQLKTSSAFRAEVRDMLSFVFLFVYLLYAYAIVMTVRFRNRPLSMVADMHL